MKTVQAVRTHAVVPSPCGDLTLVATDGVLSGLYMVRQRHRPAQERFGDRVDPAEAPFDVVAAQLAEYFAGTRRSFDLPMRFHGTEFQCRVWTALRDIPYGETVSYGQLADRLGRPTASRAVGLANGKNPIGLIVPCHRVIGSTGSLTGYGGGLDLKRHLLGFERGDGLFAPPVVAGPAEAPAGHAADLRPSAGQATNSSGMSACLVPTMAT